MDIVIVDDQPSARTMLRSIVQDIGPQLAVHDFGEPDMALEWCNRRLPDLLLLDYRMPGMDGLGLSEEQARLIELAAPLHDIGKIAIPDSLLTKPDPLLDDDERKCMQLHPGIGYELLEDSQNRFIQMGARIARHHHECYDGTGYPDGLAGEQIPIEARIVAVADLFDVLLSPRSHMRACNIEEALAFIDGQSGNRLDPDCVRALMGDLPRLHEICGLFSKNLL